MANASAKKAEAAKNSTFSLYVPFLLIWNFVYLLKQIHFYGFSESFSSLSRLGLYGLFWGLEYFCYNGISNDAQIAASSTSTSKDLAGGVYLDILGIVLTSQFLGGFWKEGCYWILVILPIWGLYRIIKWYFFSGEEEESSTTSGGKKKTEVDERTKEKREKRAERRRQKWS